MFLGTEFRGRHVVVFGGTSGINLGIAAGFATRHADVTVVSRSHENVERALSSLSALGSGSVYGACADVRSVDQVRMALQGSTQRFGLIDIVVSGAAGNFLAPVQRISANGFRAVVEIDLIGAFHVVQQALAHLRAPGASLLHISAPQACVPMRYQAPCAAAKAGLDQLTRVLALEWGPLGIRVNAIAPGPIEGTEGFRRLMAPSPAALREARDAVPLRRIGTVADVVDLALFLSSPHAGFISGAVIPCDGGGALESVKPILEAAGLRDEMQRS